MSAIQLVLLGVAVTGAGCMPAMQGAIVATPGQGQAEVRVEAGSLTPGDHVLVMREMCDPINYEDVIQQSCTSRSVGHAQVTQTDGNGVAIVQLDRGVMVQDGDRITKEMPASASAAR